MLVHQFSKFHDPNTKVLVLVTRVYLKSVSYFCQQVRFFRFPRLLLLLDGCGGKELCGEEMETIVQPRSQGQSVRRRIVCEVIQCNPIQTHDCRTADTLPPPPPPPPCLARLCSRINIFKYDNNNFLAYLAAVVG